MLYLLLKVFPESHREDYILFMKGYLMLVSTGYWIENTYKADKYSKITTAEQLTENITGGRYAYHSYIHPPKRLLPSTFTKMLIRKRKKREKTYTSNKENRFENRKVYKNTTVRLHLQLQTFP